MKKWDNKSIFTAFLLLIPIGFIIYFFMSENGLMDLIENATNFNKWWLAAGVLCQFSNVAIDAYILYKLTHNYNKNYTFRQSLKTTAVGQFFSVITPGAVGGQPMQLYCMSKQKLDTGVSTSCLIQKFLVYQTTITFYSLIVMLCNLDLFRGDLKGWMLSLAAFGFISHAIVVIFIFMFSVNKQLTDKIIKFFFNFLSKIKIIKNPPEKIKKVEQQLEYFHESNSKLYKNKKLLLTTFSLTTLQLTLIFLIPYMIYRSFNFLGASVFDMITGQAFVTMVSSFVPLPGGSGAAEGSFYVFFSLFFTENTIKSAILIWRIITYFLNIIIFAPFSNISKISDSSEKI